MRYAINWTDVLLFSDVPGNLASLVNESWPLEKCNNWEYDTDIVESSIVTDVSEIRSIYFLLDKIAKIINK